MKWITTGLGTATLLAMSVTTSVAAQELTPGTWTGTMTPPGNMSVDVNYEVARTDGALTIVISAMGQSFSFHDIVLEGDELTFWWDSDALIDCKLMRKEDGSFEGPCSERDGPEGEGVLKMVPPSGGG